MLKMIYKDLYLNRVQILISLAFTVGITLLALVFKDEMLGLIAATAFSTYILLLVPFFALSIAETEEKNRTLGFLRSLPVHPSRIVAASFLAALIHALLVVFAFTALAGLAVLLAEARGISWQPPNIAAVALTLPIGGLALMIFFRAGSKAARTSLLAAFALFYIVPIVSGGKDGFMAFWQMLTGRNGLPLGTGTLIVALSLAVYTAEYALGAWFFRRRELA